MPTIAAVDQSRPIWPASPANGWSAGVERLTSRPIKGRKLVANPHWRGPGVGGYPFAQESQDGLVGMLRMLSNFAETAGGVVVVTSCMDSQVS